MISSFAFKHNLGEMTLLHINVHKLGEMTLLHINVHNLGEMTLLHINVHNLGEMTLLHINVHATVKGVSVDRYGGGKNVCRVIVLYSKVHVFHWSAVNPLKLLAIFLDMVVMPLGTFMLFTSFLNDLHLTGG